MSDLDARPDMRQKPDTEFDKRPERWQNIWPDIRHKKGRISDIKGWISGIKRPDIRSVCGFYVEKNISRLWKMGLPNVIFVLGGPGAGKGTQCAK